jgi:hypothetical protein
MGQVTLDKSFYASRSGFRSVGDFERAKTAHDTIMYKGSLEFDGKVYTMGRSGQLVPGKVTGSFPDLLKDRFGVSKDNLREAHIAVIKDSRTTRV